MFKNFEVSECTALINTVGLVSRRSLLTSEVESLEQKVKVWDSEFQALTGKSTTELGLDEAARILRKKGVEKYTLEAVYDARLDLTRWRNINQEELDNIGTVLSQIPPHTKSTTLVNDSYFTKYVELRGKQEWHTAQGWPNTCIDWIRAAQELQERCTRVKIHELIFWIETVNS